MGIHDWFRRKPDNFLSLLSDQAAKTLEGLEALREFMKTKDASAPARMTRAEKDEDELRRILIDELNRTFVTPIDREDIFALSRSIDDILDYAYSTVDEMVILAVEPNPYLQRMVSLLRDAASEIYMAMQRLKDHPGVANEHAVRAKALENRVETVYREAIADLFKGPADPERIMQTLKLREIYRHLSNCADRGDEAANTIADIVVKTTQTYDATEAPRMPGRPAKPADLRGIRGLCAANRSRYGRAAPRLMLGFGHRAHPHSRARPTEGQCPRYFSPAGPP